MSPQEAAYVKRLQRRAANLQPDLQRRMLQAFEVIRQALTRAELEEAIRTRLVDQLVDAIMDDPRADVFGSLRQLIDRQLLDAARDASNDLPSRLQTSFNFLNPRVIEAARQLDSQAIDVLRDDVRESVRATVIDGIEAGKGPRVIARRIQEHIGLSANQTKAVINFRRQLETGDRSALSRALAKNRLTTPDGSTLTRSGHAGGKGLGTRDLGILERDLGTKQLKPEQIDRMVDAYRKRLEAWNAESHSRTIALQSQKVAQRMSWESAISGGVVDRADLRRTWITVQDSRVRDEHKAMHGEVTTFDMPFSNGQTEPGETDYNCRCVARVTLVRRPVSV